MSRKPAAGGGGTTVVGQQHKPAKPAPPPASVQGTTAKTPTAKHQQSRRKHSGKKRGLALSGLPACAAQAAGTLLGWDQDQVAALYFNTASGPDDGASIESVLRALSLRGRDLNPRPAAYGAAELTELLYPAPLILENTDDEQDVERDGDEHGQQHRYPRPRRDGLKQSPHGLILGVDLPGSHAVAVTADGTWWSWGEPFNPAEWPGLVVEEAWAVRLPC